MVSFVSAMLFKRKETVGGKQLASEGEAAGVVAAVHSLIRFDADKNPIVVN